MKIGHISAALITGIIPRQQVPLLLFLLSISNIMRSQRICCWCYQDTPARQRLLVDSPQLNRKDAQLHQEHSQKRHSEWKVSPALKIMLLIITDILCDKWSIPCKRKVSDMGLIYRNVISIKFHNKSWASFGHQMIFRWSPSKWSSAEQKTT